MPTTIHTVSTSTQFDGTASQGLIDFAGAKDAGSVVVIYSIGFNPGSGTSAWTMDLVHASGATSGNLNIQDGSDASEFSMYDARLVVPYSDATTSFELQVTTTGKTGDGELVVVWGTEREPN